MMMTPLDNTILSFFGYMAILHSSKKSSMTLLEMIQFFNLIHFIDKLLNVLLTLCEGVLSQERFKTSRSTATINNS